MKRFFIAFLLLTHSKAFACTLEQAWVEVNSLYGPSGPYFWDEGAELTREDSDSFIFDAVICNGDDVYDYYCYRTLERFLVTVSKAICKISDKNKI